MSFGVLGPHEVWSHNLRPVLGVFLGVFEVLRVLGGMVKRAKTIDLGCFGVLLGIWLYCGISQGSLTLFEG